MTISPQVASGDTSFRTLTTYHFNKSSSRCFALASTTRHGHSSQNARYVQFVKEHATGFSARAFQSSSVRDSFRGTFMVVGLGGLEPPASPLSGVRSNHLSYRPNASWLCPFPVGNGTTVRWWSLSGSNRRPPACKAGALPAELRPQVPCLRQGGRSLNAGHLCGRLEGNQLSLVSKGGDPAAPSDTATLLRLHPSHRPHRGKRPPEG